MYHPIMRAMVFVVLASCSAQPDKPLLANVPRPNPTYVAGGVAAAAAAITLADPDAASRRPEKNQDAEKRPIKVKEHVPAGVLDRLDQPQPDAGIDAPKLEPAPQGALDFSHP